jgi:hypothetical protein
MAEQTTTAFTYSRIQQLLQEGRYDHAIDMLSRRVESQPLDRAAQLLLLLANMSKFGPGEFKRQIEEIKLIDDLTGNERYIVQQIFLAGFRHVAQEGQTIQKIVYQCLLRRLMLGHPLDVWISANRESKEECTNPSSAEDISHTLGFSEMKRVEADSEMAPVAPPRIRRWSQEAMIGAGAMIIIVFLGSYVATGRKSPNAQKPDAPLVHMDSEGQLNTLVDLAPAVALPATFTMEPVRQLITNQLGALNKAYALWQESHPTASGTVALKLSVAPSGKVLRIDEVVSRLTEHRLLDVVVTEVKKWQIPLGGTKIAEISVPLIFVGGRALPVKLAAPRQTRGPTVVSEPRLTTGAKSPAGMATKRQLPVASSKPHAKTEISRTAALKDEPRFAADAIEEVDLGTHVTVLREERDWIKVKVETSGNIGYMRKEYLAAYDTFR